MSFIDFKKAVQNNFNTLTQNTDHLFEVNLDAERLWNVYLDSFPPGTNEVFRERREFDCSCCRQFIKSIGNAVTIKNNQVTSVWDIKISDPTFKTVANSLSQFVKSHTVSDVYISDLKTVGSKKNFEKLGDGTVIEWDHFHLELPSKFVNRGFSSVAEIKGGLRDTRNVFKRSLDELTEDSLLTVLEVIGQNSLYKGEEWKTVLQQFLGYKREYDKLHTNEDKENYTWEQSVKIGGAVGRIRNHSIGTLLIDISKGVGLDTAVKKYENIVAPSNYKRSKPIYTKKMLEDAQKTVQELGYMDSLSRRFAVLDDITVNNILFSNKDSAKRIEGLNVFDEMAESVAVTPKRFSKVEEVSINDFVKDVLPTAKEIEVLMENKHSNNMVSLVAPENKESKSMFKWDNGFSWAYTGNITDSDMRERVKSAGGNVEGVLRFSIQWNDEDEYNKNDFDAHCIEPQGFEIYYGNHYNRSTSGELDVDIINPTKGTPAVENITWSDKSKMQKGTYKLFVHNYSHNGGRGGFKAEVEFDGQIHSFEYDKELRQNERVQVAEVTLNEDGSFTIKEKLPSNVSSREVWSLQTNQFVPVSTVMYSPNYWNEQQGVGNRHVFFMMKGCINNERPNSMYNEFLKEDLNKHRRVFEALGGKMAVQDSEDQLSGLGFSSTRRSDLIVKVTGKTERVIKIKF